jgi:hypothetical protein
MNKQKMLFVLSIILLPSLFAENDAHSFEIKFQNLVNSSTFSTPEFLKIAKKRKFHSLNESSESDSEYYDSDFDALTDDEDDEHPKKRQKIINIHNFDDHLSFDILNLNLNPNEIYLYNETIKNYYRTPENKIDLTKKVKEIEFDQKKLDTFLQHFLNLYDKKKMLNNECLNEKIFFSETLVYTTNRTTMPKLKELLENYFYKIIDPINTDYCDHPPTTEETEDEKNERRAKRAEQNRLLIEQAVLSAPESKPLEQEKKLWKGFFTYFKDRKKEIDDGNGKKITRSEIEDEFETLVSTHYKKIKSANNTFYYNPGFIPNTIKDSEGRTNLERINDGIAPIGFDGESMNIHHITRHQPGIFVLISETMHQQKSLHLHFRDKKYYPQPKAIDRNEFNHIKQDLFSKLYKELTKNTIKPAQK